MTTQKESKTISLKGNLNIVREDDKHTGNHISLVKQSELSVSTLNTTVKKATHH
jgi:hypothetical protein